MDREVTLTVNGVPIQLDFYVDEFVYHMGKAIVESLRDTGEIKTLDLTVDAGKNVAIMLNGNNVSLKEFPMLIITSTLNGMVEHLKGVDRKIETLKLTISQ